METRHREGKITVDYADPKNWGMDDPVLMDVLRVCALHAPQIRGVEVPVLIGPQPDCLICTRLAAEAVCIECDPVYYRLSVGHCDAGSHRDGSGPSEWEMPWELLGRNCAKCGEPYCVICGREDFQQCL